MAGSRAVRTAACRGHCGSQAGGGPRRARSLWRVSDFERRRREAGSLATTAGPTVLPTTLLAELQRADGDATRGGDLLEVLAAVLREREAALLYLRLGARVWPLTVFAACDLYHSPRPLAPEVHALAELTLLAVDPPGHYQSERVGRAECYRPLAPLLWQLVLQAHPAARPEPSGGLLGRWRRVYLFLPRSVTGRHNH